MTDHVIDVTKSGKNFAILANKRVEGGGVKGLPNANLSMSFREQLNAVHNFIFGFDMPLGEEDFSFLLKYREDGRFDKIYYPNVVKGSLENENANDPNSLYIRWGSNYKKLFMWETKKKNAYTIHLGTEEDNEESEFDYTISSYGYNSEKYQDPSLVLNFIDDEGDSYTYYFPIKVVPIEEQNIDYVAKLSTAMKRGINSFLELLQEGKEYKGSTPAVGNSELTPLVSYQVNGFTVSISKKGKEITKLHLEEGFDLWCDYSLQNYIRSGDVAITPEEPVALVVAGTYTNIAKNGKEYTNYKIAISQYGDGTLEKYPNGTVLTQSQADELYEVTKADIVEKYKYPTTYSDRDLEMGIEYSLVGYSMRPNRNGGTTYKLNVIDPRNSKSIELWCPNDLIPSIMQKPEVSLEKPSVFRVVSKTQKEDKTYAVSVIDFAEGAMVDSINLNF